MKKNVESAQSEFKLVEVPGEKSMKWHYKLGFVQMRDNEENLQTFLWKCVASERPVEYMDCGEKSIVKSEIDNT